MTLQEHFERLRRSIAEQKFADRARDGLGRIDFGALLADLAVAIAFFTRLPLRRGAPTDGASLARASWCAPLVGLLIGVVAGIAYWIGDRVNLPPPVCAMFAVAAAMLLTGCLHEDGLADTADGLGGGETRERALDIMRDG